MNIFWTYFQLVVGFNLVFPIILYFIRFLRINKDINSMIQPNDYDYAIIITAYEETALLFPLVESVLKLNYNNYLVYIVADNCDISSLKFKNDRVIVLKPETILASNTKSHFYAINRFKRKHEILTILDSDNLVDTEYLNELNKFFNGGFNAVQGVRSSKSTHSTIAQLDAIRDIYYHFYDGKLLFELGSSSTLSGSGMAFRTELYKDCLEGLEVNGAGFDKVLQAEIVKKNERIAFASKAIVYDEKTTHSHQLVQQRSRWINSWFKYFSLGFYLIKLSFENKSINQFLFGLVILRPPLFIFISLSVCCLLISVFIGSTFVYFWLVALTAFLLSFYIAMKNWTSVVVYHSLLGIPKFVFFQFLSLFHLRNANKRSVATKHQIDL